MSGARERAYRLVWLLGLAGLVVLAAFTLWFIVRALGYPYQLLHGEGVLLEFSRRLAAGEPVYKPLAELPVGTCNYPPLPLLLARLTFPVLGVSMAAGRVWAGLATVAIAAILFAWVRRASGQLLPAAVAALAWLGAPYVYHWAPQFRVDLPGLALSLGGVYLVWEGWARRAGRQDRPTVAVGAALLFVLGVYCKQSFLAAPAAAFAYLLGRDRRQALILAAAALVLGGVPFLVLNLSTGGEFWNGLIATNVNPFKLSLLTSQVVDLVRTYLPLLILAGACVLLPGGSRPAGEDQSRAGRDWLVIGYVVMALLSGGLAGKVGSWENYFLEPVAALCLGAGLGLAPCLAPGTNARGAGRAAARWLAPLLVLAQVGLMWHTPALAVQVMRDDAAANRVLVPQVAATPGLVQSEDMGLLVLAGKPVPYYDFQLSQLALAGRWDQRWETDMLRRGGFSLVIFEGETRIEVDKYGRYTRAFASALDYGYRRAEQVGKYRLYRPAPLDRDRSVALEGGPALVGYTLPPAEAQPGDRLSVEVVWQATQPMTQAYTTFLHLVDGSGERRTGDDRQPWQGLYATTQWAEGEMVRVGYTLTLPVDLPAGLYTVQAGWYDAGLGRLRTAAGADSVPLAVVQAGPSVPATAEAGLVSTAVEFDGARLAGYAWDVEPDRQQVRLAWQPTGFLDKDYSVFVHLRNAAGETVAQGDGLPGGGAWPTPAWRPGVTVEDVHTISLPDGLPPGRYELVVGLYDPTSGERLPRLDGGDEAVMGEIEIAGE